jgi:hypothetical protein
VHPGTTTTYMYYCTVHGITCTVHVKLHVDPIVHVYITCVHTCMYTVCHVNKYVLSSIGKKYVHNSQYT